MSNISATLDLPIAEATQDQLDREPFAQLVADALFQANQEATTVIGLTGAWGSGKSSVANLIQRIIEERATIVRFEPWMIGTREALVREFITTLGQTILPKEDTSEAQATRSRFYRYGSRIMGVVATGAKVVGTVVPGVGLLADAANPIKDVLDVAADALEVQAKELPLAQVKAVIGEDLKNIEKPVIVIIDDIDRLPHEEIRTILQLVKACADFPKVRYLLLYDRRQVVEALSDSVSDPEAFLEKIIGQSYDLPEATEKQRRAILDLALTDLGLHENLESGDAERLGAVFNQVLLPGLTTVRQVKRFVATVRSLLPGVVQGGLRNVDPADFLALEFIRLYAPSLYTALRDEDAPQTGDRIARIVNRKEWDARIEARRNERIAELPQPLQDVVQTARKHLLDRISTHAIRSRRYISEYWRPVYLGFHSARASVSEKSWQDFLVAIQNPNDEQSWLIEWSDREARDAWVTTILSRVLEIEWWPNAKNLLEILFVWGEKQRPETRATFSGHQSWEDCIAYCVEAVMEVIPENLDPVMEFREVIDSAGSIVAAGHVIASENRKEKDTDPSAWAKNLDLQPLIDHLREPFRKLLEEDAVWSLPDVGTAISVARRLYGKEFAEVWWDSIPNDEARLINYLDRYLGELESFHYGFEAGPKIDAIRDLDPAKLTDKGQIARQHALDSVIGSSKGTRPKRLRTEKP